MKATEKKPQVKSGEEVARDEQVSEVAAKMRASKKVRVTTDYDVAAIRMAVAMKEVLTVDEAALYLGISPESIKNIIKTGGLPICRIVGSDAPLILREDLVQHVRCRREDGKGHRVIDAPMAKPGSAGAYMEAAMHDYMEMNPLKKVRGRKVV